MKSFIILAAVACVAIILLAESEAQRPDRCREKPPMNTTEDRCDRFQFCLRARQCRRTCADCYNSTELTRPPGCLVSRRCVCLGISGGDNGTTEAPTTQAPTEAPTTQAPTELPTTQAPTEAPTTVA